MPVITEPSEAGRPGLFPALKRCLLGRCPNCGEGRLMASYLKQVEACDVCGEAYGHIRPDDAAPWLTILLVGHLLLPIVLLAEREWPLPTWFSMTLWSVVGLAMTMALLPRAKMFILGILWSTRAPGSETE